MSDDKENKKEPEPTTKNENIEEKPNINIKPPEFGSQKHTYEGIKKTFLKETNKNENE